MTVVAQFLFSINYQYPSPLSTLVPNLFNRTHSLLRDSARAVSVIAPVVLNSHFSTTAKDMAPVITNGIYGTGVTNTKGGQSSKMHSKVVGLTRFSLPFYEQAFLWLQFFIPTSLQMSARLLSGMLTVEEGAVVCAGSRHTVTRCWSQILDELCAKFSR
jgi:hypothetical protein